MHDMHDMHGAEEAAWLLHKSIAKQGQRSRGRLAIGRSTRLWFHKNGTSHDMQQEHDDFGKPL